MAVAMASLALKQDLGSDGSGGERLDVPQMQGSNFGIPSPVSNVSSQNLGRGASR
jgi:hypothetical protein